MDIVRLHDEITADPLARGYAAMTDAEVAADLNTVYRVRYRSTLSSAEIYEATTAAEFQALTAAQQQYVRDIWGLGDNVQIGAGTNARAVYQAVFGPGSTTWANLVATAQEAVSRATELGLGEVHEGHVQKARAEA